MAGKQLIPGVNFAGGGGEVPFTVVTGTSQAMAVNNGYIANNASLVTLTLPATAAVGDKFVVVGKGAGGWSVAQNSGQYIIRDTQTTNTGTTGALNSSHSKSCVTLICTVANTEFQAYASQGASAPNFIVATGGTEAIDGNFKIRTFIGSGTFTITSGAGLVDSLVIAGGAGGSNGGGGAGGHLYTTGTFLGAGAYTVTVGGGGAAGLGGGGSGTYSTAGSNSVFNAFTATGGGRAGHQNLNTPGGNGGSGGGGGGSFNAAGGLGTALQGNDGGAGVAAGAGGGGGGAGAVGANGSGATNGGNGGAGLPNSITGSSVTRAGGGGGYGTTTPGSGGSGGGGAGAVSGTATAGSNNLGGGGGGTGGPSNGGAGGSGLVIVRYQFQ